MPKKEQYPEITFGAIWSNLYDVDCSNVAKAKNKLSYLPWNEAWALLMNHYPEATFAFLDNETYLDGTVSVVCQVEIHGLTRQMWLPCMNYANKTITNPSSRDISDNKMRCLVKTIAMFGLGFHIYQGKTQPEDMIDDVITEEVYSKKTKPSPAPAPPKPIEPKEDKDDEPHLKWTPEGAQYWVDQMIAVAKKMMKSPDDLRSQWQANKKVIDFLTTFHPSAYASLKDQFTALSKSLKKEETNE